MNFVKQFVLKNIRKIENNKKFNVVGYRGPTLEPGLGEGFFSVHLVTEPLLMGSGWAQPK